jgi:hypothetical protein
VTTQFVSERFGVAENFRPNEGGPGVAWDRGGSDPECSQAKPGNRDEVKPQNPNPGA